MKVSIKYGGIHISAYADEALIIESVNETIDIEGFHMVITHHTLGSTGGFCALSRIIAS